MKRPMTIGGILVASALGAASAVADSSLFPNGEPDWSALRAASSHSVASAASSLDAGCPASGVSSALPLEARYRTIGISEGIGMRSDKFVGSIVIVQ